MKKLIAIITIGLALGVTATNAVAVPGTITSPPTPTIHVPSH